MPHGISWLASYCDADGEGYLEKLWSSRQSHGGEGLCGPAPARNRISWHHLGAFSLFYANSPITGPSVPASISRARPLSADSCCRCSRCPQASQLDGTPCTCETIAASLPRSRVPFLVADARELSPRSDRHAQEPFFKKKRRLLRVCLHANPRAGPGAPCEWWSSRIGDSFCPGKGAPPDVWQRQGPPTWSLWLLEAPAGHDGVACSQ